MECIAFAILYWNIDTFGTDESTSRRCEENFSFFSSRNEFYRPKSPLCI